MGHYRCQMIMFVEMVCGAAGRRIAFLKKGRKIGFLKMASTWFKKKLAPPRRTIRAGPGTSAETSRRLGERERRSGQTKMEVDLNDSYHTLAAKAQYQPESHLQKSSLHCYPVISRTSSDQSCDVSYDIVSGNDILAGSDAADEEFDLYGELFHVFISYRVATEGSQAPGNRFARRLHDEVHALSRDVAAGLSIPPEGCGIYPSFAREPPEHSKKDQQAKV
jgi:hypothetical protein